MHQNSKKLWLLLNSENDFDVVLGTENGAIIDPW